MKIRVESRLLALTALFTAAPTYSVDKQIEEEVIVSATRTEQLASDVLASFSVVSREDLVRFQPIDLVDVFSRQSGVDLVRSGGRGAASSLLLRGANSDHTLLLLDGQRFNSATLGTTQFQFVDPEQIEKIEIVRGSRSALYGSDAIGGVVQIFTRKGSEKQRSYIKTEAGSNRLWKMAGGTGGAAGKFRYGLGLSYLETDGIDNRVDDTGFNADRDGYKNDTFNGSAGYTFGNDIDVSLSYFQTNSENHYDNTWNAFGDKPYSKSTISSLRLAVDVPVTAYWQSNLSVGNAMDDSDNINGFTDTLVAHFRSTRDAVYWQNDLYLAEGNTLTVGYEYYKEEIATSTAHTDANGHPIDSRDNQAMFVQYQGEFGDADFLVGIREDDNEAYGSQTTGNVAVGYQLNGNYKVVVSWAEGFKAPTFNDLYWPAGPFSAGNPDVIPESSESYEASLRGAYQTWAWSLALFSSTIDNLIDWAPGADFVWRPSNIASAKIKGAELEVDFTIAGFDVSTQASVIDPIDESTGRVLQNRVKRKLFVDAGKAYDKWHFGMTLKAQSKRATNTGEQLPGYGLVGVYVGMNITDNVKIQLKLDNLLDKNYQLNEGFNEDGLNGLFSLSYRF